MNTSLFFICLVLPILSSCFYTEFGPYGVNGRTVIYRAVYMYAKGDAPKEKADGKSRLGLEVYSSAPNTKSINGELITAFMPEEAFRNMGYKNETGHTILCCDEYGFKNGLCTNKNSLIIPQKYNFETSVKTHALAKDKGIDDYYSVPKTGMYYVVAAVCNPTITVGTQIQGQMIAENPYGHLPATQYSSFPFYSWMSFIYVIALLIWGMLCIQYSKEIMSVHLMILSVLICFVINYLIKCLYLWIYNTTGYNTLIYVSIFFDVFTRTLTRILTILVCMGLGVSCASIPESTCKLVFFAIVYFVINCWDSYMNTQPSTNDMMNNLRVYITAGIDAIVYFWIFQSLMDTMDNLKQNKQNAKLNVFIRLYSLLLISVIVSTITLIVFSYLVSMDDTAKLWKYQWFMNDGVWCVYYLILFVCLMIMWKPNENTSAYAYHTEIATEACEDDEEYGLPQNQLIASGDEDEVVVNTIDSEMKPMGITANATEA